MNRVVLGQFINQKREQLSPLGSEFRRLIRKNLQQKLTHRPRLYMRKQLVHVVIVEEELHHL